jgi:hypothetical protein
VIFEIIQYTGTGLVSVPVSFVMFRVVQFRNAIRRGKDMHEFKAHTRRDMYGPHVMNYCDVCRQGSKAWIHSQSKSIAPESLDRDKQLRSLERDDIKWRFENDPEWVKVFGEEYDQKTFYPIPQFHNGECGGALDSCPRCNWEYEQQKVEAEAKRYHRQMEITTGKRDAADSDNKHAEMEIKEYEDFMWTIWNTIHGPDEALSEFQDILDELGMIKRPHVRDNIKKLDVFERLNFCLATPDKRWNRREEVWHNEKKKRKDRERYRYDHY